MKKLENHHHLADYDHSQHKWLRVIIIINIYLKQQEKGEDDLGKSGCEEDSSSTTTFNSYIFRQTNMQTVPETEKGERKLEEKKKGKKGREIYHL